MINDHDNHEQAGNAKREPSVGYGKDEELARQEKVSLIFLIKHWWQIQIQIQIQIRQAWGGGSPGSGNNFTHRHHCHCHHHHHRHHCHHMQHWKKNTNTKLWKCLLSRAINTIIFIATIILISWLKGGTVLYIQSSSSLCFSSCFIMFIIICLSSCLSLCLS